MKKILLLLMLFLVMVVYTQNSSKKEIVENNFTADISEYDKYLELLSREELLKERKSPGLAFLFSFLFVGGGQFYNGDLDKGAIHVLAAFLGASTSFSGAFFCPKSSNSNNICTIAALSVGASITLINNLWSWIDAIVSATNKNKAIDRRLREMAYGHLFHLEDRKENVIGIDLGLNHAFDGGMVELSYHF